MNRTPLLAFCALLTLVALAAGTFVAELPQLQYLGNTVGVLLGFVLGIWWAEKEKHRQQKEKVAAFWREYSSFLPRFENRLATQISSTYQAVHDSVIEYRLPLSELLYLRKQADQLDLEQTVRKELADLVTTATIIEEYIDYGAARITQWHTNFGVKQQDLRRQLIDLTKKYPVATTSA